MTSSRLRRELLGYHGKNNLVVLFTPLSHRINKQIAHNVVDFLFVDDFAAGYASTNMNIIERKLQQTVNKLENWANNNGFRFSVDKTYIAHLCTQNGR